MCDCSLRPVCVQIDVTGVKVDIISAHSKLLLAFRRGYSQVLHACTGILIWAICFTVKLN